jgi:hypothetical protein
VLLAAVTPALAARLTLAGISADGAHVTEAAAADAAAAARQLVAVVPCVLDAAEVAGPGPRGFEA